MDISTKINRLAFFSLLTYTLSNALPLYAQDTQLDEVKNNITHQVESDTVGNNETVLSVNINIASAWKMAKVLQGVGRKKAKAIVLYRKKNGEFKTIDELLKVKGINQKLLDKNKGRINY